MIRLICLDMSDWIPGRRIGCVRAVARGLPRAERIDAT